MNLAECIAALPRVERGLPRDIFAPLPTCPSPYSLELTLEYTRHINAPEDRGDASTSATAPRPPALRQQQQQPHVQSQTGGKAGGGGAGAGSGGFNCAVCKKSFSSEATWNNHQLSAKHIAAVKDADKKKSSKTGSKGGGKSTSGHQKQQQQQEEEQDPPEVVEALASFRKVEKISGENPGMAAPVLWKIAKALWSHRRAQETTRVLSLLIRVLDNLQQAASMTGSTSTAGKAPATAGPGSLSPTQISMTLYLSQLAMARLTLFISPSIAQQYYLDAIQGRWQMDPADIQSICEMVSTGSVVQLLERCREYLATHPKTEKLMTPLGTVATAASVAITAPKKPTDPNLKFLTILLESASMLSQHHGQRSSTSTSKLTTDDRIRGEASIALYAMSAALTGVSSGLGDSDSQSDSALTVTAILRNMATMYKHLNMLSSAAACLIRAGELELVTSKMRSDHQQGQLMWDLFQALLLAIDTADLVRMQRVIGLLEQCGVNNYLDVQTVVEVAQAVLYQDNDYLTHSAAYAIEHLLLLLHEGDADSKAHLLIYQNTTPAASIDTLIRVQQRVT
ncbi:hypothetical protein BGZ99_005187 [Dissophora globulifera]|uniref:C2H2-type domain-containing protein n=1 Tax=Dissophora globulifera TaxID=979702 RepID=A0A9P6UZT0_9FUNG|nr:hypothetical protein BGZ99_005187 [Dissophora globulifera]